MNWLKRLFGMADRNERATERISLALEGIADVLEEAQALVRQRFSLTNGEELPALPEPEEIPTNGKGKKKRVEG